MPDAEHPVVVVEDDASMRQAIERILGAAGFRVAAFASAEALLAEGPPAGAGCLVLDVQLPGLSGLALHQRLAAAGAAPPAIFITAHDAPATRAEVERADAVAYLTKPFRGRSLVDAVSRALEPDRDEERSEET
jgi:FixJ family two-component response regulator